MDEGDDVELVGHNPRLGQHHVHGLTTSFGQVHRDRLHRPPIGMSLEKPLDVDPALALHNCDGSAALEVPEARPHHTRPPDTEAIDPEQDVRLVGCSIGAVGLDPAPLDEPFANPVPARHCPDARFLSLARGQLAQTESRPAPPAAGRVILGKDLVASTTAETPLPDINPYRLAPQLSVSLALLTPLVNLPGRTPTPRTGGLLAAILRRHLDPIRVFGKIQDDQAG